MPLQHHTISTIAQEVDVKNAYTPMPVLKTKTVIAGLATGDVLRVLSSNPDAVHDLPLFCTHTGHELVSCRQTGEAYEFLIRKC